MDRPLIQNTQQDQQHPRYDDYLKASSLYSGPVTDFFFWDFVNGNLTKYCVKGSWAPSTDRLLTPKIQWDNSQVFREMVNISIQ
jgi:hypothetical protein